MSVFCSLIFQCMHFILVLQIYVTLNVPHSQGTLSTPILISFNAEAWKTFLLNSKTKKPVNLKTFWTTYSFIHSLIYLFVYLFLIWWRHIRIKTATSDVQSWNLFSLVKRSSLLNCGYLFFLLKSSFCSSKYLNFRQFRIFVHSCKLSLCRRSDRVWT